MNIIGREMKIDISNQRPWDNTNDDDLTVKRKWGINRTREMMS